MDKPQEPTLKMLVIPANNSATGLFQILNDNDGKGLIFETEGDTLAQTFKSEHGNYSDGFRKAFHHETITYNRRRTVNSLKLNCRVFLPYYQALLVKFQHSYPMLKMVYLVALYSITWKYGMNGKTYLREKMAKHSTTISISLVLNFTNCIDA